MECRRLTQQSLDRFHDHLALLQIDAPHDFLEGGYEHLVRPLARDIDVVAAGRENLDDRAEVKALRGIYLQTDDLVVVKATFRQWHHLRALHVDGHVE